MTEQIANFGHTTLAEPLDNAETGVDVTSGAVFPSSWTFRVKVDDEIMLVTARTTNTLTVERGAEGTTPATHDSGAAIDAVLTAGGLTQHLDDRVTRARAYYRRTSGNYVTTSTSFVDIDATNLNWTKTTGARRVKAGLKFTWLGSASGTTLELLVDGVALGGGDGGVFYNNNAGVHTVVIEVLTAVLSAGSHTFKWQYRLNVSGSFTIYGGTTAPATPLEAWLEETEFDA